MRLTGVLFYAIALPLIYTGFRRRGPVPGPASQRFKASMTTPSLLAGTLLGLSGAILFGLSFASS